MIPLEFETPDPDELRLLFAELGPEHRQCGLDDEVRAWFADERFRVATRVTAAGSLPQARQFCKGGCPAGARGALWQNALGAEPSETVPISIFLFSLLFTCSYFMNCRSFFHVAFFFACVYSRYLCVSVSVPQDVAYFEQLVRGIERVQMLADDLHRLDVRTTANDDNYFVFEDVVCSSLRVFLIVCLVLAFFA